MNDTKHMTEGEYRVGITFNPGGSEQVNEIKQLAAELIDMVEASGKDSRCTALAMTAFEDGAMWAVKSVTKQPKHDP